MADQSSRSPSCASSARKRSRNRLASGKGTRSSSAAANASRISFWPSGAAKPAGLEGAVRDQRAVGLVDRSVEQRGGEDVQILVFVDPGLLDQRHRLAERLDNRRDQEIPAQLHEIGVFRGLGDVECLLAHRIEQRLRGLDRLLIAGRHDIKQLLGGGLGPAEHGRGDIALACFAVGRCELFRQRDADRACGDVHRAGAQTRDYPALAKSHGGDSLVIRKHGDDCIALAGFGNLVRDLRALRCQRRRLAGRAVVHSNLMTGLQKVRGHALAHAAQPDESHLHKPSPSCTVSPAKPVTCGMRAIGGCCASRCHREAALAARANMTRLLQPQGLRVARRCNSSLVAAAPACATFDIPA